MKYSPHTTERKNVKQNQNNVPDQNSKHLRTNAQLVANFHQNISQGPFYICLVSNRMFYKRSVRKAVIKNYPRQQVFTDVTSFDGNQYICSTSHSKCTKNKIPCQASCNKMELIDIPPELAEIDAHQPLSKDLDNANEEEIEDPQNEYRNSVKETCLQSHLSNHPTFIDFSPPETSASSGNEIYSIAPGEGKHPIHFMKDNIMKN